MRFPEIQAVGSIRPTGGLSSFPIPAFQPYQRVKQDGGLHDKTTYVVFNDNKGERVVIKNQ